MILRLSTDRRWPMFLALFTLLPALGGWELLRKPSRAVEAGNGRMKAGKPDEALVDYDKAVAELPADPGAHFDRGAALFALSRFDEAAQEFLRGTESKDTPLKSQAFYNLGNAFFKKDKFKEAFEAYKRSLELDPKNDRAKWNAEIALAKQREEDKKKQDKKDEDKKDDKDKKESKKDSKDDSKKDEKPDEKKEPKEPAKDSKKDEPKDQKPESKPDQKPKETDRAKDQKPEDGPPPDKSAEQREMESALDGLDKSPRDLEKQRALMRAVRRAPPTRDW